MSARRLLAFNDKPVEANVGESLIDAALGGSILIPHDCRSGQCESCRVTIVSGSVDDRGTAYGRTVLACQSGCIRRCTDRVRAIAAAGQAGGGNHRNQQFVPRSLRSGDGDLRAARIPAGPISSLEALSVPGP